MIPLDDLATWHVREYPDADYRDVAIKFAEEAGEVMRAVDRLTHDGADPTGFAVGNLAEEAGDAVIALTRLLDLFDLDLEDAVRARWGTVKQRRRNP